MCDKVGKSGLPQRPRVGGAPRPLGLLVLCALLLATLSSSPGRAAEADKPPGLRCLERYYHIRGALQDGHWVVRLSKSSVPYDDGTDKNAVQRIETPDLEDMFRERYRIGPIRKVQRAEEDPGRARVEALFMARYGRTPGGVAAALQPVDFMGTRVRVHRLAAPAFRAVVARLQPLLRQKPALREFVTGLGGTFAWRPIAGTQRRSAHSYGIAIDLNVKRSHYWRWRMSNAGMAWNNSYPQEIVDAFEAEGFIWGGRWYHYDTMHFEYRPELLDADCYPGSTPAGIERPTSGGLERPTSGGLERPTSGGLE